MLSARQFEQSVWMFTRSKRIEPDRGTILKLMSPYLLLHTDNFDNLKKSSGRKYEILSFSSVSFKIGHVTGDQNNIIKFYLKLYLFLMINGDCLV